MKNTFLILSLLAVFCGCASAEPPAHISQAVNVTVPAGAPVDGIVIYGANHVDTNWTRLAVIATTNGQTVTFPIPFPAQQLYTSTTTNSQTGGGSDYGSVGQPLPVPGVTVK